MKHITLTLITLGILNFSLAQKPVVYTDVDKDLAEEMLDKHNCEVLVYEENFSGSSIDTNDWFDTYQWGYANTGHEYNLASNVTTTNGTLKIKTRELSTPINGIRDDDPFTFEFSGGAIHGKRNFKYGRFEARLKVEDVNGVWPAFWLLGANCNAQYNLFDYTEFDIAEFAGSTPRKMYNFYHFKNCYPTQDCGVKGQCQEDDGNNNYSVNKYSDTWLTIGAIWDEDAIYYYLKDGGSYIHMHTKESDFSSNSAVRIILNHAIGGGGRWGEPDNPPAPSDFPAVFEVDYVRVYKRLYSGDNITYNDWNYNFYPNDITGNQITFTGNSKLYPIWHNHNKQKLDVHVLSNVTFKPGFHANKYSSMTASIVECPKPDLPWLGKLADGELEEIKIQPDHSIQEVAASHLEIYPNPSDHGVVQLKADGFLEQKLVQVIDMYGKVVLRSTFTSSNYSLDLTALPKGIYAVKVKDSKHFKTERLILN